jgi:hypothetical protein
MLTDKERTALLLLIIVAAALASAHLLLAAVGKEIVATPYSPDATDGALVILKGNVEDATTTQTGGHQVLVIDGVKIFVPAKAAGGRSFTRGELLRVVGQVQHYQGEREIVVDQYDDIRTGA